MITGGIPAEYVGATGLISNVVTKSGSNLFHGSANYFFQNGDLVAENQNGAGAGVLDQGQRLHLRRSVHARQGVVLRQLPLHQPRGRRHDARHQRVPAHRRQHPAPGLRQGQLGGEQRRHGQLHLSQRPDRHHRTSRPRHHQRARPGPRAGRPPLPGQLHPGVGQHPARGLGQQAQRRSHRPVGDPRVAHRRAVPRHRQPDADRRAARRLRPRSGRQARQQGHPRHPAAGVRIARREGRRRVGEPGELPRHDLRGQRGALQPESGSTRTSPLPTSPPAAGRTCSST